MALAVVWYAVAASQFETVNVRGPFVLLVAGFIGLLKGVLGHED